LESPLLQLENLAKVLGVSLDYFIDNERGPLGRHEAQQRLNKHLEELPNDLKDFVAAPINISYLETAKRLSEMDVKRLRRIAEGILDITF
jgi:transcriptional regulator with XRE-family HTH domain